MKRIVEYLWGCTSVVWETVLGPTIFGLIGALLSVLLGEAILATFASGSNAAAADDSLPDMNVVFIVGIIGFCGGLAIWRWRQPRGPK